MSPTIPLNIDVHAVKALLDDRTSFLLLDCREPDEYQVARIEPGQLIPMGELPGRLADLEAYRDQPIVVYCHVGGRSLRVVRWLRAQGFPQAQNMDGGIEAWSQLIDPSVPRY